MAGMNKDNTTFVYAKVGHGMSFYMNALAMDLMLQGLSVVILDIGGSYARLEDSFERVTLIDAVDYFSPRTLHELESQILEDLDRELFWVKCKGKPYSVIIDEFSTYLSDMPRLRAFLAKLNAEHFYVTGLCYEDSQALPEGVACQELKFEPETKKQFIRASGERFWVAKNYKDETYKFLTGEGELDGK